MKSVFIMLLFLLLSVSVVTAEAYPESAKVSKTILFSSGGVGQESVSAILVESAVNHQPYQHSFIANTNILTVLYKTNLLPGFKRDIIDDRLKYAIEF